MSAAPADLELKRLAPVASAATNAAAYASKLAASAQSYVPEALEPLLTKAGGAVAPYASLVADKSAAALKSVDGTVDTTIAAAWQTYTANSQAVLAVHATNLQHFASARKAYLAKVEESVAFVKGAGVGGAAKAAADALLARVSEARQATGAAAAAALNEISEAWSKLVHMPAVERAVAVSQAQVEAARAKYSAAHDALVADPRYQQLYSMAVARGSSLLAGLQASAAYQAAAARLGPLVAPYAEGCAKVASPYLQAAAAHLAPSVAAA